MSQECNHDCGSCSKNCSDRPDGTACQSLRAQLNELSSIKKVIAVVSGKGGVGKSLVTGLLASMSQRLGKKTAVLDADITGPSIPRIFGVTNHAQGSEQGIYPEKTATGIDIISINLLLDNPTDPVIWRGPIIAGVIKQFWSDVIWNDIDTMFIDMPPGTGDVPLTVFQSLPIDGIVVVTTPQDLVSMIVKKAAKMAEMMNIPILGLVENMSYIMCPDCCKKISLFGDSRVEELAKEYGISVLARIPIDPSLASLCDAGKIEQYEVPLFETNFFE